jgi:hypothetical protein
MNSLNACLIGLTLSIGISACTVEPAKIVVTETVVSRPPPPVRVEQIPPPPTSHPELVVWQPGHWHWNGHDYEWYPGRYEKRPSTTAVWVPPEWVPRGNNEWVFKPGHWVYH